MWPACWYVLLHCSGSVISGGSGVYGLRTKSYVAAASAADVNHVGIEQDFIPLMFNHFDPIPNSRHSCWSAPPFSPHFTQCTWLDSISSVTARMCGQACLRDSNPFLAMQSVLAQDQATSLVRRSANAAQYDRNQYRQLRLGCQKPAAKP